MDYDIEFETAGKKFKLLLLAECSIDSNVELLADTAIIILPEAILNNVLNLNDKIKRGSSVTISLGYDGVLKEEFKGYVKEVSTNDSKLSIICEDELFQFRKPVSNKHFKKTSISKICEYLILELNSSVQLECDFDLGYNEFTIYQATAFDVLKKLAEESKANVYFKGGKLHFRAPYLEKGGNVIYNLSRNVESSSLEFKTAADNPFEIVVESVQSDGKIKTVTKGSTGGEKITIRVGNMSPDDLDRVAKAELDRRSADRYEGSIDSWLIPFCAPTFTAKIKDPDYPEKDGQYYVKSVKTTFSSSGGKRSIELGVRL